jgi:hypothetical protein
MGIGIGIGIGIRIGIVIVIVIPEAVAVRQAKLPWRKYAKRALFNKRALSQVIKEPHNTYVTPTQGMMLRLAELA